MKSRINKFTLSACVSLMIAVVPTLQAQDIVGELKYRCDQVGGIVDEDYNCIEPIEATGGDVKIELSDVELPTSLRSASGGKNLMISTNVNLAEQPPLTHINPVLFVDDNGGIIRSGGLTNNGGFNANITQQEGLRICFYELEVDVRNCQHAFGNNIEGYNECVMNAGEAYQGCLTWVSKLPYEENQN